MFGSRTWLRDSLLPPDQTRTDLIEAPGSRPRTWDTSLIPDSCVREILESIFGYKSRFSTRKFINSSILFCLTSLISRKEISWFPSQLNLTISHYGSSSSGSNDESGCYAWNWRSWSSENPTMANSKTEGKGGFDQSQGCGTKQIWDVHSTVSLLHSLFFSRPSLLWKELSAMIVQMCWNIFTRPS